MGFLLPQKGQLALVPYVGQVGLTSSWALGNKSQNHRLAPEHGPQMDHLVIESSYLILIFFSIHVIQKADVSLTA